VSWESSIEYYRMVNELVLTELGGVHNAKSVMVTVDFGEISTMMKSDNWDAVQEAMVNAGLQLKAANADFIAICSNTMHKMTDAIEAATQLPLLHIADATAEAILKDNFQKVGLLGTASTMEEAFYKSRLVEKYGFEVLIPEKDDRKFVDDVIFEELVIGNLKDESRTGYQRIIKEMQMQGAQAVILGCTEIGHLIKSQDSPIPTYDTAILHAKAIAEFALNQKK
jgi:aspartate racemase